MGRIFLLLGTGGFLGSIARYLAAIWLTKHFPCHFLGNIYHQYFRLPAQFILQLRNFFEDYMKLEKKEVKVGEFQNAEIAKQILTQSIYDYQMKFKK